MNVTKSLRKDNRRLHRSKAQALLLGSTLLVVPLVFAGIAAAQTSTTAASATTTAAPSASTTSASSASTTVASLGSTTSALSPATTGPQLVSTTLIVVSTSPASSVATTVPSDNVTVETPITEETSDDSAVPEGGIDTGLGGTATESTSQTTHNGMLATVALFAIAGTAVTTVRIRRRDRS
jgi:hypothetical protein